MVGRKGQICSAIFCSNTAKNNKYSLFRFPKEKHRCKMWVMNVRRTDLERKSTIELYNNHRICAVHFEPSQFNGLKRNRLISNAVPTLFDDPNPRKILIAPPKRGNMGASEQPHHKIQHAPTATMSIVDDDVIIESSSSGPATPMTPMTSNPGTPRSMTEPEMRNTPPPSALANTGPTAAGTAHAQMAARQVQQQQQQQQLQGMARAQPPPAPQSKYTQLLAVIEDMGKDIRPTYAGSKTSAERLKRGIVHARILVRECLMECERAART